MKSSPRAPSRQEPTGNGTGMVVYLVVKLLLGVVFASGEPMAKEIQFHHRIAAEHGAGATGIQYLMQQLNSSINRYRDESKDERLTYLLGKKSAKQRLTLTEAGELICFKHRLGLLLQQVNFWKRLVKLAAHSENEQETIKFSDANEDFIASVTGVDTSYRFWGDYLLDPSVKPSHKFKEIYDENARVFSMTSEASRRTVLDIFLRDVLAREEFGSLLRIFPGLDITVTSNIGAKRRKLSGNADYAVGWSLGKDTLSNSPPTECHLIAVEAKKDWGQSSLWLCVAEIAALHKARKDAGKANCNTWGILSNANIWQFFLIDNESRLWTSDQKLLSLREYNEEMALPIYQLIHHIVKSCIAASPPPYPQGVLPKLGARPTS